MLALKMKINFKNPYNKLSAKGTKGYYYKVIKYINDNDYHIINFFL